MKIACKKCNQLFMDEYNKTLCPDCKDMQPARQLTNCGQEDLVTHFKQDTGLRLQRLKWGHFR